LKKAKTIPTFSEQLEVIKDWWKQMVDNYVKDFNLYEPNSANWKDVKRITELDMEKVYNFLIEKRIVGDR
jgi:hypothetical protein